MVMTPKERCVMKKSIPVLALLALFWCMNDSWGNLITNGDFGTDLSGWTTFGTVNYASGIVNLGGGGNNRGGLYQTIGTTAGEWYKVTYDKRHAGNNNTSDVSLTLFDGAGTSNANAFSGQYYRGADATGVTAWFQAQSGSTTVQLRDYSYSGSSHDVRIDNVVVEAATIGARDEVNIAGAASLSQSSYYDATTYPQEYGNDGVVHNFMHTAATGDSERTYTMTFATDQNVGRIAIVARSGFTTRVGASVHLYDGSDALIETLAVSDGIHNSNLRGEHRYWNGVKKVVVQEDAGPLNFADVEVFAVGEVNVAPTGAASSSSVHSTFGIDPAQAIDESGDYVSSGTVFHSANLANDWWRLDFDKGFTLNSVEIQARRESSSTPYNDRIGTLLEFLDADGNTIYTEAITPSLLWTKEGTWEGVYGVRITDEDSVLNLAEVRLFADTSVAPVPEPSTFALAALGLVGLIGLGRRRKR
jgi:MYXO-CTERM domain-containing protein